MKKLFLNLMFASLMLLAPAQVGAKETTSADDKALAEQIRNDKSLDEVVDLAHKLLAKGFFAGSGYSQVWSRDMNTFVEAALDVVPAKDVRGALLVFFALKQPNGEAIDGYVTKDQYTWEENHPYYSEFAPNHVAFKNTVETDQETSTIQALYKYVKKTGDRSILTEKVGDRTVTEHIRDMINFLLRERFSEKYGLIYGAMTADWGDVQPLTADVVDINDDTYFAIDAYDNAMLIIALDNMKEMGIATKADMKLRKSLAKNVRKYLWDEKRQKIRPHVYLDKSPIPEGFDEEELYCHGGTAIAIEAGLLTKKEIATVNSAMVRNVKLSGMPSIGLTLYPPYPEGFFHGGMGNLYNYQNGGDWTWFGGRMIQQLVRNGFVKEAYEEIRPMIDRVIKHQAFYEWWGMGCTPSGSGEFKGSAGVLVKAIEMMREWSKDK
jgi:hypothetical protein